MLFALFYYLKRYHYRRLNLKTLLSIMLKNIFTHQTSIGGTFFCLWSVLSLTEPEPTSSFVRNLLKIIGR